MKQCPNHSYFKSFSSKESNSIVALGFFSHID